jgi:hypothetical protein
VKTLAEIAIEAGLVNRASAAKAGRLADERRLPLVAVLVRELAVDEVALVAALHKQTRVTVLDPAEVQVDPEALRQVPGEACARLRVLPLSLSESGGERILRVAMADPTDSAAIAELEQLSRCELEVTALPLSAVEELVDRGYRAFSTAVVPRPSRGADNLFITTRPIPRPRPGTSPPPSEEGEVSVTAQIPIGNLNLAAGAGGLDEPDLETRVAALYQVLLAKGLVTEAELLDALRTLRRRPGDKP